MKNKIAQFFLFLALVIGAAGVSQAAPYQLNIPFDFTVNGKLMKAGNYSISFGVSSANAESFLIRSADGKSAAIVNSGVVERNSENKKGVDVVFEKNGNEYSLSKISSLRMTVELSKENNHQSAKAEHTALKTAN